MMPAHRTLECASVLNTVCFHVLEAFEANAEMETWHESDIDRLAHAKAAAQLLGTTDRLDPVSLDVLPQLLKNLTRPVILFDAMVKSETGAEADQRAEAKN